MCVLHLPVEKMSSCTHHADLRSMKYGFSYREASQPGSILDARRPCFDSL